MTKKEARIARKLEKTLREQEKREKLVRNPHVITEAAQPRADNLPDASSVPRASENPKSIMDLPFSYDCETMADLIDQWSWGQKRDWNQHFADKKQACEVTGCMESFNGLTWSEIMSQTTGNGKRKKRRKKHHSQPHSSISAEARNRWKEIERTEDQLFRFRYGGTGRIWGVRTGALFSVVWWDPDHKIYPTER